MFRERRAIHELKPGDIFYETPHIRCVVEKNVALPVLVIPGIPLKSRLYFRTDNGVSHEEVFESDQIVAVEKRS